MKLLLLKILLQRRAKDEGFTLPMVIALGLVMILLGAVNITSANEENLNAITKNSGSDALAIAEIGVARYRQLLDKNRTLALYDHDQWIGRTDICFNNFDEATDSDGNDYPDDDDIPSFVPGTTNTISLEEDTGIDLNNDGDTTDSFGSYELVSYDYSNANNTLSLTDDALNNDARGVLKVKGITPDGNEAQIQVDIPIRINTQDMANLAPALWIGNDTISDFGTLTVNNGNVVLQDKAVITGTRADGCGDFSSLATLNRPVISDPRDLPSIQPIISAIAAAGTEANILIPLDGVVGTTSANAYRQPPAGETFDESVHCANVRDCRYYYNLATAQTLTNNVVTDGIARATLYINSTLTISPAGSNIRIGSGVASNYFEIYVDSGQKITIDTTGNKTVAIDAFIHAPNSQLEITGNGTVNINGSVWVNDFVKSTNATVTISADKSDLSTGVSNQAYEFYTTTNQRTPKPITGSPVNWKTEEVD